MATPEHKLTDSEHLLRIEMAMQRLEEKQGSMEAFAAKTSAKIDVLTAQQNRWQGAGMILMAVGGLLMGFLALGDRLFK